MSQIPTVDQQSLSRTLVQPTNSAIAMSSKQAPETIKSQAQSQAVAAMCSTISGFIAPVGVPYELGDEEDIEWLVLDEDDFNERFRHSTLDGLLEEVEVDTLYAKKNIHDYVKFLRNHLDVEIENILMKVMGIVFLVEVQIRYFHPAKADTEHVVGYHTTGEMKITHSLESKEIMNAVEAKLLLSNSMFVQQYSGLVIEEITKARFKVLQFLPMAGRG